MHITETLFYAISGFFILATLLPLIRLDHWWIRIFGFPRVQITVIGIVATILATWSADNSIIFTSTLILLVCCLVYQCIKIIPYTPLYPVQIVNAGSSNENDLVKLMIANVYMNNRDYASLARHVIHYKPDILLVVEVNHEWCHKLRNQLEFDHEVCIPLENTYGMAVFSNLPLSNTKIEYIVKKDVPSIHTDVLHSSGQHIKLSCLHPKPPAPQESKSTTKRDAELLIVGKRVKDHKGPTIVAGDLNDVAWSYTTALFQKISSLLDLRIGRGMFNSYHAKLPFLRFPLDHVFVSKHFSVRQIQRLSAFGSDHFPIYVELQITPENRKEHNVPTANSKDEKHADKKINNGFDN